MRDFLFYGIDLLPQPLQGFRFLAEQPEFDRRLFKDEKQAQADLADQRFGNISDGNDVVNHLKIAQVHNGFFAKLVLAGRVK